MGIEVGFFGLIILALDVWAIIKIMGSGATVGSKLLWTVLILILPLLGFLIWLIAGPKGDGRTHPV